MIFYEVRHFWQRQQTRHISWTLSFQKLSTLEVLNTTRGGVHMDSPRKHGKHGKHGKHNKHDPIWRHHMFNPKGSDTLPCDICTVASQVIAYNYK